MADSSADRSIDTGSACLVMISRFHGVPADDGQLRHQFGTSDKTFDADTLLRAAKSLGLKARAVQSDWSRLDKIRLPVITETREGKFFILAQVADDKLLVHDPLLENPRCSRAPISSPAGQAGSY